MKYIILDTHAEVDSEDCGKKIFYTEITILKILKKLLNKSIKDLRFKIFSMNKITIHKIYDYSWQSLPQQ